jgi:hypothetical protein
MTETTENIVRAGLDRVVGRPNLSALRVANGAIEHDQSVARDLMANQNMSIDDKETSAAETDAGPTLSAAERAELMARCGANWRHGGESREAIANRRLMRALLRQARFHRRFVASNPARLDRGDGCRNSRRDGAD